MTYDRTLQCQEIAEHKSKIIWSDEHLDILKDEWAKGSTGSQIGNLIGKTRNAVIGKANRLGLEHRAPRNGSYGQPKKERTPRKRVSKKTMVINPKAAPPRFYPAAVPITSNPPISIMELGVNTCHAIVGHGANGLAVYCGDMTFHDKPFCEGHCAMYYQPADYRRRSR